MARGTRGFVQFWASRQSCGNWVAATIKVRHDRLCGLWSGDNDDIKVAHPGEACREVRLVP